MIEDALKTTRKIHGITLISCLATLFLAISIALPTEDIRRRDLLKKLAGNGYREYAASRLQLTRIDNRKLVGNLLQDLSEFDDVQGRLIAIRDLSAEYCVDRTIAHFIRLNNSSKDNDDNVKIARLLIDKTPEVELPDLPTDQTITPSASRLTATLDSKQVVFERCHHDIARDCPCEHVLLHEDIAYEYLYELTVTLHPSNVTHSLKATFNAKLVRTEVSNSSFVDWLVSEDFTQDHGDEVTVTNGSISLKPSMSDEHRDLSIGLLAKSWEESVLNVTAERMVLTVLNNQVRGKILFFVPPATNVILLFLLFGHTLHLTQLAERHTISLRYFSWLPLIIQSGRRPMSKSIVEHMENPYAWLRVFGFIGLVVTPPVSILLFFLKLSPAFGGLRNGGFVVLSAVPIALIMGTLCWTVTCKLRHELSR